MAAPVFPPHKSRPANAPKVLEGIRVIDFSRVLAGPWASQYLADMGADVIKIEDHAGDMGRWLDVVLDKETSSFHIAANRNKRSLVLDLRQAAAREIIFDLLKNADVLIENFTSRVMQSFGLDYESIREQFPQLIYCSISAYGRTGSEADAPGYDPVIAAETGGIALNAMLGTRGCASSLPTVDLTVGMNGAIAILGALIARERLGSGQFVEAAMYDSGIANLVYKGGEYLATGNAPTLLGRTTPYPPSGELDTQDGAIWVVLNTEKSMQKFFIDSLGRPDLLADERFSTPEGRRANSAALYASVNAELAKDTSANWARKMKRAGVPCGPVLSVAEACHADLTAERELISMIPHPVIGPVFNIASPIRMSMTPAADPIYAPLLGEHSISILRDELGYSDARIAELREQNTIGVGADRSAMATE